VHGSRALATMLADKILMVDYHRANRPQRAAQQGAPVGRQARLYEAGRTRTRPGLCQCMVAQ
jgi:hypothetical protein